jgi:predicted transposase/invertase (TIGR01784 family)
MKFADPKNDLAFKKIFGDKNHTSILISLLNSILDFKDGKTISKVELVNPYQVPKIPELKETILDIKATNKNGETFIVEMQRKDLHNFAKRSLYYTSKAYTEQLNKSEDYSKLKKVYFIGIIDFNMFDNIDYISRHLIINQETNKQDLDDFEFSFIELPKFDKKLDELSTTLEKWIYFIKNADNFELIPETYKEQQELNDAFIIAAQVSWTKKEIEIYDYMRLKQFDEVNAIQTAENKGFNKGIEKGILGMLEFGIGVDKISKHFNLPISQIKKILLTKK